jgi:hypothetical protein
MDYGFLDLEITVGQTDSVIGRFYSNNGTIADEFVIQKYPLDSLYRNTGEKP